MSKPLRVGIVGASAADGWARISHVPAVKSLSGLELAAVATRSQKTANAAAKAFGTSGFGDPLAMVSDPRIDIVSVVVRAPAHRELVLAAISAGKHVYCEWPLGRNTAEAEEMAQAAQATGVHVVVGLQARASPAVKRARELIAAGAIGRVLSARVTSATVAWGPTVSEAMDYAEDDGNGVDLQTIQGAHTLDLAICVLGQMKEMTALLTTQYPQVRIGATGDLRQRKTPDHLLVSARLEGGAAMSVEVAGGRPPESPFHLEVIGENGTLTIEGGAPRGAQSGRFHVYVDGAEQAVDEGEVAGMTHEAASVAGLYALLRDDILNGTRHAPDFDHAVRLARLVDDTTASSRTGSRRVARDWPAPLPA